jgi:hypothetical protein
MVTLAIIVANHLAADNVLRNHSTPPTQQSMSVINAVVGISLELG